MMITKRLLRHPNGISLPYSQLQLLKRRGRIGFATITREDYLKEYNESINPATREEYWRRHANNLHWNKKPTSILDMSEGEENARWFKDGKINACYNAVDVYANDPLMRDVPAILYDSPVTGVKEKITWGQLQKKVQDTAFVLRNSCNVNLGDRVVIYMPMIPECLITMLACARIGAPHSVVFGGFAAKELAIRITDAKAKCVVSATCGIEGSRVVEYEPLVNSALEQMDPILMKPFVLMKERTSRLHKDLPRIKTAHHLNFDLEIEKGLGGKRPVNCLPVPSTHPLYILYTSGTTGTPKGIVRDTGGYLVALRRSMNHFMGIKKKDVYLAASDMGWVVGHSYILYGPLLAGATTVLYEGKPVLTPDAGAFWRLIEEYQIKAMFAAPTALRAIRKYDPNGELIKKYKMQSFKTFFVAGERADVESVNFFGKALNTKIVDNWWQTETGHPICGYQDETGLIPGSTSLPCPGFDVQVMDKETKQPIQPGEEHGDSEHGDLCIKLPLPPGALWGVYNNHERYLSSYMNKYKGYYATGDLGYKSKNGYVTVMSRDDDIIKIAGHRLSTGTIENAIVGHPGVLEVAVIGANEALKGELPIALVVLHESVRGNKEAEAKVEKEVIGRVRELVGPVASFHDCFVVPNLPKTRSGKVLRGLMKKIADEDLEWEKKVPGTIEDVNVLHAIEKILKERWISKKPSNKNK